MNQFIYDLTSYEKARESLSKLVGISEIDIEIFVHKNAYDYDCLSEKFIEQFNIDMESFDISNMHLKIMQVTTNGDNCESIKRYGVLNTQEAIKEDTYLARYLKSKGIRINFEEESINFNGNTYYRSSEINREVKLCCTKLFSKGHYPINAFIYSDSPQNYGGGVKERPELIGNLAEVFGTNIEEDWIKNTKCFIVVFKVLLDDFHYSTFTNYEYEDEEDKNNVVKRWLIKNSLNLIHNFKLLGSGHRDIYAFLKPEHKVEPQNILGFIQVNK